MFLTDGVAPAATVADRHRTEHEVHHIATGLARWSREDVRRLAEVAPHHDMRLDDSPDDARDGIFATLRKQASAAAVNRPEPGLLLLRDLRDLHVAAVENSLHWEMPAQAVQASRDSELLRLASDCHPQTLRQMRWTHIVIKNLAPQILTSL
ncbi:hypothetical protein ACFWR9_35415 [Streptomyces sp. NPDC058534]|uniref:hypothetical protein n=1 Tax=Streptomyces sp. NPDC058534 TaxID=3346541 RepID=UPI003648D08C